MLQSGLKYLEVVWKIYEGRLCREHTIEPRRHGGGNPTNLTQGDLQLIETCKKARPSSSLQSTRFTHERTTSNIHKIFHSPI